MFRWREREPGVGPRYGVDWAITDRAGGVSLESYSRLNLGAHVGDDLEAVSRNRSRVAEAFDLDVADLRFMRQVHGCDIATVDRQRDGNGRDADIVITDDPDVALVVLVADCTPVLLLDRTEGLVAAVHAGRVGFTTGVVDTAVSALRERGAKNLEAVVGPSVCPRCYEVPADLREAAAEASPAAYSVSSTGTPAIDVAAGVVDQLQAAGVSVTWLPGCTREDEDLFSHRRDGVTGRFGGVVRLLPPEDVA
ncbi:peptidoglycan editing factor PgeF [Ornithinimicrobium ciconiae]|uniref:Purine nucleoside phosphorylase n=1 Tax=Ornithinimicrobium ciconiae TaxID=2594265 RepID=A0A516G9W8_9MICO|nr:peptidoglycan editing factor PgeF [Ornithinimicrobium ciconiae]QDO88313.1 peptidoglycan editing factor PgeF [Ornithinimicrobium ciconiae]